MRETDFYRDAMLRFLRRWEVGSSYLVMMLESDCTAVAYVISVQIVMWFDDVGNLTYCTHTHTQFVLD